MKWDEIIEHQCSVARSLAVLGDRWTLLILSDCFLGVKRFDMFQSRLGLSRTTLTNRLKHLEKHGVLKSVPYQTNPTRHEYKLTQKGLDLYPVISTLVNWGDQYYSDKAGPPIVTTHKSCGTESKPVLVCPDCGEEVNAHSYVARKRPEMEEYPSVSRGPVKAR